MYPYRFVKKNKYSRTNAHLPCSVPHEINYIKSTEYLERIKSSSFVGKPKGKSTRKQFYIIKVLMFHGVKEKEKKKTAKGKGVFVAFGYFSFQIIYYGFIFCSLLLSLFKVTNIVPKFI